MFNAYTKEGYDYKLSCDGYDLSKTLIGQKYLNEFALSYVNTHCVIKTPTFDVEEFILRCMKSRQENEFEHTLPLDIRDKYQVGFFETSLQNCFDSDYILFNKEQLEFWCAAELDLWGIKFMVIPSRDKHGIVNELGFRILNPEKVNNAFKWLFPFGQQGTFGLDTCDLSKPITVVEGALDYIALRECGHLNTISLGSIELCDNQEKELAGLSLDYCFDADPFGRLYMIDKKPCFFAPDGEDPYAAWIKHGWVKLVHVA